MCEADLMYYLIFFRKSPEKSVLFCFIACKQPLQHTKPYVFIILNKYDVQNAECFHMQYDRLTDVLYMLIQHSHLYIIRESPATASFSSRQGVSAPM